MLTCHTGNHFVLREEDLSLAAPMFIADASHQVSHISHLCTYPGLQQVKVGHASTLRLAV